MNTIELALKEAHDAVERGVSLHPVTVERLLREIERLTAQAEASRLNAEGWMEVATDLRKVAGRIHGPVSEKWSSPGRRLPGEGFLEYFKRGREEHWEDLRIEAAERKARARILREFEERRSQPAPQAPLQDEGE